MAAACGVLDRVDAWLEDPDVLRAEFDALMAANFPEEPPGTADGPTQPSGRGGPEQKVRRRPLRSDPRGTAPALRRVARERGPPATR